MHFDLQPLVKTPRKKKNREMTWTIGQVANMCNCSKTTVKKFALMLNMKPANSTGKWIEFTRIDVERIAQVQQLTLRLHYDGIRKVVSEGPEMVLKTLDFFQIAVPKFHGGITING